MSHSKHENMFYALFSVLEIFTNAVYVICCSSPRSQLSVMRAHLGVLRRVTAPNFMKPHTATDVQPLQHSDNNYCCFFGAVRKSPPIPDYLKGKGIKAANSPLWHSTSSTWVLQLVNIFHVLQYYCHLVDPKSIWNFSEQGSALYIAMGNPTSCWNLRTEQDNTEGCELYHYRRTMLICKKVNKYTPHCVENILIILG